MSTSGPPGGSSFQRIKKRVAQEKAITMVSRYVSSNSYNEDYIALNLQAMLTAGSTL